MVVASSKFRPLPFLGNPHVQTLLGHFLRGPLPLLPNQLRFVPLPDGDQLVLHDSVPPRWQPGQRVVLLVHGMGGSHRSGTVLRMADALYQHGLRVVRMDLRGAGLGEKLARRLYTAGCSNDVRAAAAEVQRWSPSSPLALVGISLGGNIVLKLAGESATQPLTNLERVAAVAPPIDMVRCAELMAQRRNRLYEQYFVRALVNQVQRHQRFFRDIPRTRFPQRLTIREFDELYTAPRWGFAGALEYYREASAAPLVERIPVPALLLTSRDDPFIAVEPFEALPQNGNLDVQILDCGGHLGFLGWDGTGVVRWAERRVLEWLLAV
jgi:hypothetical protein